MHVRGTYCCDMHVRGTVLTATTCMYEVLTVLLRHAGKRYFGYDMHVRGTYGYDMQVRDTYGYDMHACTSYLLLRHANKRYLRPQ